VTITETTARTGLDVANRVRGRDIQMAASADLRRRVLMISGAIDTNDHDIAVTFELPAAGRWQVIKSETNLTSAAWLAWQMIASDGSRFVEDSSAMMVSQQFKQTFMAPDGRRIVFYDGEVRPGEAVLKLFSIESNDREATISHYRFGEPMPDPTTPSTPPKPTKDLLDEAVANGFERKPVIELFIPVTVIA
jgi:hypothetical protein